MLSTLLSLLALALMPAVAAARQGDGSDSDWRFLTRATLSDDSHKSSPKSYEIHGGLSIEGALERNLGRLFAIEVSLRTESREVDGPGSLPEPHLGSLELAVGRLGICQQHDGDH